MPSPTAPHPPLLGHYAEPADRQAFVNRLFDDTARHYDRINGVLSFGTGSRYRRAALRRGGLRPGMAVLDVGCGTGVLARHAADVVGKDGSVVGVDPSRAMREEASRRRGVAVLEGTAERLPVPDATIDFLCMGYALRHVDDLGAMLAEFRRVLRPDGRVLLLEITAPETRLPRAALRIYLGVIVPRVARLLTGSRDATRLMDYYWDSIEHCVRPPRVLEALVGAGFEGVARHVELGVFSEYGAAAPDAGAS